MFSEFGFKRFKNHTGTVLKLHSGLNVVTGDSDEGKSNLIQGIKLLVTNRPSGLSFRTKKSKKDVLVYAKNEKGICTIVKGDNTNQYRLNGEVYKALKQKVPSEVKQFLDIDEINIQSQFSPFFLLQESAGKVAQYLNKVVGLSIIDDKSKLANKIVSEAKTKYLLAKRELDENKQELKKYKNLGNIEILINSAQELFDESQAHKKSLKEMGAMIKQIKGVDKQLKNLNWIDLVQDDIDTAMMLLSNSGDLELKIESLDEILSNYDNVESDLKRLDSILSAEQDALTALSLEKNSKSINTEAFELNQYLESLKEIDSQIAKLDATTRKNEKALLALQKKLGVCPLCKGDFNNE